MKKLYIFLFSFHLFLIVSSCNDNNTKDSKINEHFQVPTNLSNQIEKLFPKENNFALEFIEFYKKKRDKLFKDNVMKHLGDLYYTNSSNVRIDKKKLSYAIS
jgi:hypothetical protein